MIYKALKLENNTLTELLQINKNLPTDIHLDYISSIDIKFMITTTIERHQFN